MNNTSLVVTLEEHVLLGGLGSAVSETICDYGLNKKILRIGLPDRFISGYGSQNDLMEQCGLSAINIAERVMSHIT